MPHTFKSHSSILNPSVFATALVFFIVLFGSGLVTVWAEEEQAIYKLQVNGLSCPFCNFGIEKGFMSVNGVEKVRIDITEEAVFVIMEPGSTLTQQKAQRVVEDAGFTLAGFEKLPAGESASLNK